MKILLCLTCCISLAILPIHANSQVDATLSKCTDGDTAHFLVDGKDITARFLAIDTPEYTKEKEPYGKEASALTCNTLQSANKITLEYDQGSDKTDKYGRHLVWVYVDGVLLQELLVSQGLAKVAYVYGNYAYTQRLQEAQDVAKEKQLHIWSGVEPKEQVSFVQVMLLSGGFIVIVILSLQKKKGYRRKVRYVKRFMKKIKQ